MRAEWVLLGAAVAACTGPPLVDMTNVDPVVYQRDLDGCEATSHGYDAAGPLIVAGLMGATIGGGIGTMAGASTSYSMAAGYGAAAGAVAGVGVTAATSKPLAAPPPAPQQTVAQCLTAHGYKVISPGQ